MAARRARAFWATAPFTGEIRSVRLPAPGPGEVLVETLFSAISRGTEAIVCAGRVPPDQYRAMRCPFQEGDFPFPVKYGYSNVGRVLAGPGELVGRTVFGLFPHQTRFVVPADAVHPLPEGVPPGRAVLAASMETALNGLWDAAPLPGERMLVVGAGVVGALAARLASRIPGIELQLVDIDPQRGDLLRRLGIPFALPEEITGEADLVLHASGAPEALARALSWLGFEGRVVELSWYGDALVPLPLGSAFHSRRLAIRSSQVGHVAPAMRPRWDRRRRMAKALELLADPALDVLITGESRFEELPEVLPRLAREPRGTLCHRIVYGS
jgi:2-desacetyl-2-hydroxyethyl bacteriochlorophyllide A dehydrogenase